MSIKTFFKNAKEEEKKLSEIKFSPKERWTTLFSAYLLSAIIYLWAFIILGSLCVFAYYINYFILGLSVTAYLYINTAEIFRYKMLKQVKDLSHIDFKYFHIEMVVYLFVFMTIIYFVVINIVGVFL